VRQRGRVGRVERVGGVERVAVTTTPPQAVTGFLLRSDLVSGWPGLEVTAYGATGADPLTILRFERLAPTILICLFDGVVDHVDIHEPPEGLHFGFDVPDAAANPIQPKSFFKTLRSAADGSAGQPLAHDPIKTLPFRGTTTVVRVDDLAGPIIEAAQASRIACAAFALEMVEGVGLVRFQATGPST
jgi:hypothetical protein